MISVTEGGGRKVDNMPPTTVAEAEQKPSGEYISPREDQHNIYSGKYISPDVGKR